MAKLKVWAKKEVALHQLMAHPVDGIMRAHGSHWEDDTWTHRRLRDDDITMDEAEAWHAPPKVAETPNLKKSKSDGA